MTLFFWNDVLSVGNPFIDNDHRHLIELMNTLNDAIDEGRGQDVLATLLNDLVQYTREHFEREENVMRRMRYAEFSMHKEAHDRLTAELCDMQNRLVFGERKLMTDLLEFLVNWLFQHIMKIDQNLAQAIREAESGGDALEPLPNGA